MWPLHQHSLTSLPVKQRYQFAGQLTWVKSVTPSLGAVKMFVDLRDSQDPYLTELIGCRLAVEDSGGSGVVAKWRMGQDRIKFVQGHIFFLISTTHWSVTIFSPFLSLILHLDFKFLENFVYIPQ